MFNGEIDTETFTISQVMDSQVTVCLDSSCFSIGSPLLEKVSIELLQSQMLIALLLDLILIELWMPMSR
jgi:hypothetical protein